MLPPDTEPTIDEIDFSDLGMISDDNADAMLAKLEQFRAEPLKLDTPPAAPEDPWVITGEAPEKGETVLTPPVVEKPTTPAAVSESGDIPVAKATPEVKPASRFTLPKAPTEKSKPRPPRDIDARVIYHQPIRDNQVLTQAMRLPADKVKQVTDFAYDPDSDALISKANFRLAGIQHELSPSLFKLLRWCRGWLPKKNPLRLSIDRRATVRLGTRFAWRPAIRWKNSHNKPVQYYQLVRLPSGVVVQVQSQKILGKLSGETLKDKEGRHAAKDDMLAMIQQVEQEGYTLQNDQSGLTGKPGL